MIIKTIILFLLWKQRLLLAAQENYEFDCIAVAHWLDNQIEIQTQHLWMTKIHWLCLPNSRIFLCQLTNEESAIQTRIVTRHPIRLGSKQFLLDVSERQIINFKSLNLLSLKLTENINPKNIKQNNPPPEINLLFSFHES